MIRKALIILLAVAAAATALLTHAAMTTTRWHIGDAHLRRAGYCIGNMVFPPRRSFPRIVNPQPHYASIALSYRDAWRPLKHKEAARAYLQRLIEATYKLAGPNEFPWRVDLRRVAWGPVTLESWHELCFDVWEELTEVQDLCPPPTAQLVYVRRADERYFFTQATQETDCRSLIIQAPGRVALLWGYGTSLLLAAWPLVAVFRGPVRRWRRRKKGRCVKCNYDLTGNVSGICPECGSPCRPKEGQSDGSQGPK